MVKTAGFPAEVLYERMDIRVPEIIAYQMVGFAAAGYPPDRLTDAIAANIAAAQSANGSWLSFRVQQRPGGEDGDIFARRCGHHETPTVAAVEPALCDVTRMNGAVSGLLTSSGTDLVDPTAI